MSTCLWFNPLSMVFSWATYQEIPSKLTLLGVDTFATLQLKLHKEHEHLQWKCEIGSCDQSEISVNNEMPQSGRMDWLDHRVDELMPNSDPRTTQWLSLSLSSIVEADEASAVGAGGAEDRDHDGTDASSLLCMCFHWHFKDNRLSKLIEMWSESTSISDLNGSKLTSWKVSKLLMWSESTYQWWKYKHKNILWLCTSSITRQIRRLVWHRDHDSTTVFAAGAFIQDQRCFNKHTTNQKVGLSEDQKCFNIQAEKKARQTCKDAKMHDWCKDAQMQN